MQGSMGKALQAGTKAQKGGCIHRFSITLSLKELIHTVIFGFESILKAWDIFCKFPNPKYKLTASSNKSRKH